MPNKVERLVRDALSSPVRITVGELGAANEDITQVRHHLGLSIPQRSSNSELIVTLKADGKWLNAPQQVYYSLLS